MWSLGNEVQEGAGGVLTQAYADNQKKLIDWTLKLDTTRPATRGDNVLKGIKIGIPKTMMNDMTTANGTVGLNYCSGNDYDTLHNSNPNWKLYGSETASAINSRGVYDRTDGSQTGQKLTLYDNSAVNWGAVASSAWYEVVKRDFVAGEYVWTGFDYIGNQLHGMELEMVHKEHGRLQRTLTLELLIQRDFQKIVITSIKVSGMMSLIHFISYRHGMKMW